MKTFLPFCVMLLSFIKVSAQPPPQYLTGGEMYYTYQGELNGEHVYRVTLQCYAKCANAPHLTLVEVNIFDRVTNVLIKRVRVPLNGRSRENLQRDSLNDCLINPPSSCNIIATYSFEVSLPASANGYLLSCSSKHALGGAVYREENIANLLEKGFVLSTYTSEIPAGIAAVNSTFNITGDNLLVSCANSKFSYRFGASDYDGDELRYYLGSAYQAGLNIDNYVDPTAPPPFQPVLYTANFSSSMPLGANVSIDEKSGLMTGIAPGEGSYLVTICVGEYRNGVLIATQRKEVHINIAPCEITTASLLPEYMVCGDNKTLQLSNLSSTFRVEAYSWQISGSDGTTLYSQTTPTISYSFADTGIYNIKLVINKGKDCRDSTTSIARVYPGLKTDFSVSETCIGKLSSFTNNTTATYGQLNYWKWDFGDYIFGGDYNSADVTGDFNPAYQYRSSGTKKVQLIVGTTMGCRDTLRKTINILPKPPIIMTFRDAVVCARDTIQLLAFAPEGGNFSWSPQINMVNSNSATPRVAPAVTTVYRVLLDNNACQNTDSVVVRVTNKVFLQAMNDTTVCQGDTVQLKLVSDASTYSWTNVTPANAALPNPTTITDTTTVYEVTASIGRGCLAKDSVRITTLPHPRVYAGADTMICSETSVQLRGSTDGSSFSWYPSSTLNQSAILNPVALPKQTTSYILTVSGTNGCLKPSSDTVLVTVLPPIKPFAGRDTVVVIGQPLQFNASGGVKHEWTPSTALSANNIRNPVAIYNSPYNNLRYKVRISNEAGCIDSAYVNVRVIAASPRILVPTAFTPNKDGKNDQFSPIVIGNWHIKSFYIYNRWGQVVFKTHSFGQGWDGMINGISQNTGVFTWVLKAIDSNGKPYFQKGLVTLIR